MNRVPATFVVLVGSVVLAFTLRVQYPVVFPLNGATLGTMLVLALLTIVMWGLSAALTVKGVRKFGLDAEANQRVREAIRQGKTANLLLQNAVMTVLVFFSSAGLSIVYSSEIFALPIIALLAVSAVDVLNDALVISGFR